MAAIVNVNVNSNVNISVCFSSLFFVFLYFCLFTLLLTKTNEMSLPYYSLVLFVKNCAMLITLITYNVSILLLGVVVKNNHVCQQKKGITPITLIIYHSQYLPGFALINTLQIFLLPKSKWVLFVRDRIRAPSPEKKKITDKR